jgi:FecR-like protein
MRRYLCLLLLAGVLVAPGISVAQQDAGRVLVAAGNVTIMRAGQTIPAQAGTLVRSGDTVAVGPQSSAQIRFTDDSLVALRADTTFRVSEYAYGGQESSTQRALFDLLQGGLRTVTGIIGRRDRADYAVKTRTTTIGIRGTSYSLVDCDNSCRNADGSLAPDGTYGAVTEGRISATNNTGEREFGVDNFFYVASPNSPPEQLLAPPSFLAATRGRATGTQLAQAARSGAAAASSASAAQATSEAATGEPAGTTLPILTPVAFQVTSTPHPETLLSQNTFTGTTFYRLTGPFNIPFTGGGQGPGTAIAGEITLGVNYALQRATLGVALLFNAGGLVNVGVPLSISGLPITINGNQVSFSGTFNLADFPNERGAFRCACVGNNTPGFLDQLMLSGTVSGTQATVTLFGIVNNGGGATGTATLTQEAPPNNAVAAIVTPNQAGGSEARSAAFWNVQLDASGRLLQFGPNVGQIAASVGTATNTIAGTAPGAGNLVWGTWGPGARITDFNYNTFTTTSANGQRPWISGDATNSLPASLGSLTFTPVGSVFSNTNQTLNSASLTADFVNRSLSVSLNASNTAAKNTFQMDAVTGFSPTTGRFSAGFNSVTCAGPCVGGVPGGSFAGFFAGAQAQGAGVAFTAGFGTTGGVSGVVAFGRPGP